MNTATECLHSDNIQAILSGEATQSESETWEAHVSACEQCRIALESRIGDEHWWNDAEQALQTISAEEFSAADSRDSDDDSETLQGLLKLLGPTDDPRMLGRIGAYEVLGVLGRGGMGIVFKAFESSLNRYVAIKMLLPHLAAAGAARKRFEREGQAAAAVIDDHVLPIYAVAQWQTVPYLVMQYSSGSNLQKRLDHDGPFDVKEILRIGMQTSRGLAAAHSQGLVHRDVKPSNILLDGTVERVMLTDFGLARAIDDASITRTGTIAGTPQYMSPEQVKGEAIDARSDLFGLGCVLYALSTGHPPFRAESSYAVLRRITDDQSRPIRETNPDVPLWLEQIVMKLLAKSPDDRFESAEEVAVVLEDCLAHVQQPTITPLPEAAAALLPNRISRPPIAKLLGAAAFAFALIIAGVVIVLELNKGTLTIECDADDVPIRIMQGEKLVQQMTVSQGAMSTRIAAGNYVIEVEHPFDGLIVKDGRVILNRGKSEVVKIVRSDDASRADVETKGRFNWEFAAPATQSQYNELMRQRRYAEAELLVRKAQPLAARVPLRSTVDQKDAANALDDRIPNLPKDTEVHVVGCYSAKDEQPVDVHVRKTGKPMVVVLTAYHATSWNLDIAEDADVRGVIVSGYFDQRFSHMAPATLPTRILTYFPVWKGITSIEKHRRHERCFYAWSCVLEGFQKMSSRIQDVTGRSVTTFQGTYHGRSYVIDGRKGLAEPQIASRWKDLSRRSDRDTPAYLKLRGSLAGCKSGDSGLAESLVRLMHQRMDEYEKQLSSTDNHRQGSPANDPATSPEDQPQSTQTPFVNDTLKSQVDTARRAMKQAEARSKSATELDEQQSELQSLEARYQRSAKVSELFRLVLLGDSAAPKSLPNDSLFLETGLKLARENNIDVDASEVNAVVKSRAELVGLPVEEFYAELLASRGQTEHQYRSQIIAAMLAIKKMAQNKDLQHQFVEQLISNGAIKHPGPYDPSALVGTWTANCDVLVVSIRLNDNGTCALVVRCLNDEYHAVGAWRVTETKQVVVSLPNLPDGFPESDMILKGLNGGQLQYKAMTFERRPEDDSVQTADSETVSDRSLHYSVEASTTAYGRVPESGRSVDMFVKIPERNSSKFELRPLIRNAVVTSILDPHPVKIDHRQVTIEMQLSATEIERLKSYEHRRSFSFQPVPESGDSAADEEEATQSVQLTFSLPTGAKINLMTSDRAIGIKDRAELSVGGSYGFLLSEILGHKDQQLHGSIWLSAITKRSGAFLQDNSIPIVILDDDIEQCESGAEVIKVLFLPDAANSNAAVGMDTLVSTRLDPGVDPTVEARRRGTIVAVIRLTPPTAGPVDQTPAEPTTLHDALAATAAANAAAKIEILKTVDVVIPLATDRHSGKQMKPILGKHHVDLTACQRGGAITQDGKVRDIRSVSAFAHECHLTGWGSRHINGRSYQLARFTVPTEYLQYGQLKTQDITQEIVSRMLDQGATFQLDLDSWKRIEFAQP